MDEISKPPRSVQDLWEMEELERIKFIRANRGLYTRAAARAAVHPSMPSKVVSRKVVSAPVEKAITEELKLLQESAPQQAAAA